MLIFKACLNLKHFKFRQNRLSLVAGRARRRVPFIDKALTEKSFGEKSIYSSRADADSERF